jgi:hypothetical protein
MNKNKRELGNVLRNISVLHGIKPEDTIVKYNELQLEVLRKMAREEGYATKMFSPEVHEQTVDKLYAFYEKESN